MTMNIICTSCQKRLALDETKLPMKPVIVPCPVCSTKLTVDRRDYLPASERASMKTEATPPSEAEPAPRRRGDRVADAGGPSVPGAPVTEFELPGKMREIVAGINVQLIDRCRVRVADAERGKVRAENEAREVLAAAQARIAAGVARIIELCSDAEKHLNQIGVETDDTFVHRLDQWDEAQLQGHEPDLDAALEAIEEELDPWAESLVKTQRAAYLPANGAALIGIVVGSVFLAYEFFWPLLVTWPAIVAIWRAYQGFQIRKAHAAFVGTVSRIRTALAGAEPPIAAACNAALQAAAANHAQAVSAIRKWAGETSSRFQEAVDWLWEQSAFAGAEWDSQSWQTWEPDPSPEFGARIGTFTIRADDLSAKWPQINFTFKLPALIPFADERCLMLDAAAGDRQAAAGAMQAVIVRALANTPPGKARFTFIDPVALGQNVADFMQLGDVDQVLIGGKAWSEPHHVEQQLAELTEHMETVIQKYLRKDYSTIREYNKAAEQVAEPFRFLVVFDFPVNFTESAARRLVASQGPRPSRRRPDDEDLPRLAGSDRRRFCGS